MAPLSSWRLKPAAPAAKIYAQLQVPMARTALADSPQAVAQQTAAQQLLNALSEAAIVWGTAADNAQTLQADPLFLKMAQLVERTLAADDQDVPYEQLLAVFEQFSHREQHRQKVVDSATRCRRKRKLSKPSRYCRGDSQADRATASPRGRCRVH